MNHTALVLAAHGSHSDRKVNRMVCEYAQRIAALGVFDEVSPAFHQGEPAFSAVLDRLSATRVVVVPLMTSAGYYSEVVLPRELRRNRRFRTIDVNQTEPVGTHRDVPSLLWDRVAGRCEEAGFVPGDTTVIVVGHGTKRYARSRETTLRLVDRLAAEHPMCEFLGAFLDDDPRIESALALATRRNIVVEPFLIADGPHTALDIPARLGLDASPTDAPPTNAPPMYAFGVRSSANEAPLLSKEGLGEDSLRSETPLNPPLARGEAANAPPAYVVDGRTVVCDAAFGTDPRVIDLILDLAGCADGQVKAILNIVGLGAAHRKDNVCAR